MDYFHGIAINAKKEVLTDMSSVTNTTVNTVNSGDVSSGGLGYPFLPINPFAVRGSFNSNTTTNTTTKTSTTHTHIWTFQLKGQGKDLFRAVLDKNFLILDGDEMAGYAEKNGGYIDCGLTKNITRKVSNEDQFWANAESYKPRFDYYVVGCGTFIGGILLFICICYFQILYFELLPFLACIGSSFILTFMVCRSIYKNKRRKYKNILADTKRFFDDFENRVSREKIDEETGLITKVSSQVQITETNQEAQQIEMKQNLV